MKKVLILVLAFALCAPCYAFFWNKKEKPVLFLSPNDPRNETEFDKTLQNHSVFKMNTRIYFLVYVPDGFKSDYVKYQIVKQDDNAHVGGYSRIRNITRRLNNKNYFVDYFVLSESGKYALQIFDITNVHQWLAFGHFLVVEE